ncbi:sigma-70 family RNA polymerase sigma factor [Streptomyces olindensis]|uniref:Sigma-70 family RNA polymerase sigma factor n=1 Tax=Streptomyces olindensis TaxID=358823 RepID=A0ABV2Y7X1_9ACTN
MATDMPAETHANTPAGRQAADDRWERMWSHREQLLKVARRRSMSQEDAEDAVHEAMLRAAERPDLDDERLGAWLTTVTMRLCVDRYRQVNREAEVRTSPTLVAPGPVPVEEVVCDRAEARWLAVRSGELPARQAEALRLKSEDLDVGQVAVRMGLSYRTVESLLARARRTLRASLAGTLGAVLFLLGRGRPHGGGKTQAVAVASTAATLVVAGVLVLPYALDGGGDGPAPRPAGASPGAATVLRPDGTDRISVPRPARSSALPSRPEPQASPADGSLLPLSVPDLPAVSPLPELSAPEVPDVPELPALPDVPVEPAVPVVPSVTAVPSVQGVPSVPPLPSETPTLPGSPSAVPTPSPLP